MMIRKPTILIYTAQPDCDFLKEICAGIEEEGLLYEVVAKETKDIDSLAWQAANDSMLGSGIGACGQKIALQMQSVPKGKNVQYYNMPTYEQCRILGANSARAIKKQRLK